MKTNKVVSSNIGTRVFQHGKRESTNDGVKSLDVGNKRGKTTIDRLATEAAQLETEGKGFAAISRAKDSNVVFGSKGKQAGRFRLSQCDHEFTNDYTWHHWVYDCGSSAKIEEYREHFKCAT